MAGPNRRAQQNRQSHGKGKRPKKASVVSFDSATSRYAEKNAQRSERSGYGEIVPLHADKFVARTDGQRRLMATITASTGTFALGPAGTGKTHVALAYAVKHLKLGKDHKVVCTNPAVEIGQKLGTLPGDKNDKVAVSIRPMRDILNKLLGASHVENLVGAEKILFEPLGSILGTTFDDAIIILDEAQNATPAQMKALLTRVGRNSKIIICGDYLEQKFIPGKSGLEDAIDKIGHLDTVGIVEFTVDDIVRSDFCSDVIKAYRGPQLLG